MKKNATLDALKNDLGISGFHFEEKLNEEGVTTNWARHWENDKRVSIVIHMDTVAALRADIETPLFVKESLETPEGKEPYTLYVIGVKKNIVFSY